MKDNVMRDAVLAKFSQHENLKMLLIETGDAILIEHTENDAYWGDGGNGHGRNRLGQILMETREKLAHSCGKSPSSSPTRFPRDVY